MDYLILNQMNRKFLLIVGLLLLSVGVSAKRVGAYCYFANNGSQLYEDNIVKVELTMDNMNLALVIYNKTENVIYLDNKNSFIYSNGEIIGTLSNDPTIGNDVSAFILPPESRKVLCTWKNLEIMFDQSLITRYKSDNRGGFINPETGHKEKFEKGLSRSYTKERNPFSARAIINYSTDKNLQSTTKVTVSNYVTDIIIDSYKGVKDASYPLPNCAALKERRADYSYISGYSWANTAIGITTITIATIVPLELILLFGLGAI